MVQFRFFLRSIPRTIIGTVRGRYVYFHVAAIVITLLMVVTGLDWWYFSHTRFIPLIALVPAFALGGLLPILAPLLLLAWGSWKKSALTRHTAYALGAAAITGSLVSSIYKAFTGRIQPDLLAPTVDISHAFQFGFWRHGVFWGWPSSHTTIAFAMAVTLVCLFPKNVRLKYAALLYAMYVGLAVSISIHWGSDFIAGALLGSAIGMVVAEIFTSTPLVTKG